MSTDPNQNSDGKPVASFEFARFGLAGILFAVIQFIYGTIEQDNGLFQKDISSLLISTTAINERLVSLEAKVGIEAEKKAENTQRQIERLQSELERLRSRQDDTRTEQVRIIVALANLQKSFENRTQ